MGRRAAQRIKFPEETGVKKCVFCKKNLAYYRCPFCRTRYCNTECFKSHCGLNCLERYLYKAFKEVHNLSDENNYKLTMKEEYDLILSKLFPPAVIPQTKLSLRMEELIRKMERSKGANMKEILAQLTKEERKLYNELMVTEPDDEKNEIYPVFWDRGYDINIKKRSLYDDAQDPPYMTEFPQYHLEFIPPLAEVTNVKPSAVFFGNLCNVLAVYSIIVRFYNGEHIQPYAMECTKQMITISGIFVCGHYYTSKKKAIHDACKRAFICRYIDLVKVKVKQVTKDVNKILRGPCADDAPYYTLYALGDIRRMFHESNDETSKRWLNAKPRMYPTCTLVVQPPAYDVLTASFKKLNHLYSYVLSYYSSDWTVVDSYQKEF